MVATEENLTASPSDKFEQTPPDTPRQVVERSVRDIQMLFGAAFGGLVHTDIHPLAEIPPSVQSLWSLSTTSIPMLLDSSQCWRGRNPLVRELVQDTLACITTGTYLPRVNSERDYLVHYQGEVDTSVDPATVIAQLLDPDPLGPVFLTGMRLQRVTDLGFRCPPDLCMLAEPMDETNAQVNVTPKFAFVDLHVGKCGLFCA